MDYFSMDKNTTISLKEGLFLLYVVIVPASSAEKITGSAFSQR